MTTLASVPTRRVRVLYSLSPRVRLYFGAHVYSDPMYKVKIYLKSAPLKFSGPLSEKPLLESNGAKMGSSKNR